MEVHAHSHTPRKKWTHYFWEFLMLFLAVFCGFLAEYQLEHKIEREKEKEYMEGMLEDLANDTANLNRTLAFVSRISNGLDSLQQNLYNTSTDPENVLVIYRQNAKYLKRFAVNFTDQTATQLRNAGALRLVRNKNVVNGISRYWRGTRQVENIEERIDESLDEIGRESDNIINRSNYLDISKRDSISSLSEIFIKQGAMLMTTEKKVLISYANKINRQKNRIENFYTDNLHYLKSQAGNLIQLIKKEYHLK